MLKLINVGAYEGSYKQDTPKMVNKIINAINNNSDVFSAVINGTTMLDITSNNITITGTGFNGSASSVYPDCGYTIAIDDEKEFLMIITRFVYNTNDKPYINNSGNSAGYTNSMNIMMCVTAKDLNGNNFNLYFAPNTSIYGGLSVFLDIGQKSTEEFETEGDYILRQGAIRNHIVPELFFSMTRLGACGDIIEKDGHQYTCIAGPIFYQIS